MVCTETPSAPEIPGFSEDTSEDKKDYTNFRDKKITRPEAFAYAIKSLRK